MMFSLKTAPATFQRIIMEIFAEYIPGFMQVFLDDFACLEGLRSTYSIFDYAYRSAVKRGLASTRQSALLP